MLSRSWAKHLYHDNRDPSVATALPQGDTLTRPFVFINVAMTADGKIDTFERKGAGISSKRDKERVDQLRAESDAVLVGGKTLLEENPKLTVKSEALREDRVRRGLSPNPIKVGIASRVELHPDSDFLKAGPARIVIFTTYQASKEQVDFLRGQGVEVFIHDSEYVDLSKALETLYELGARRIMVEGGGTLNFELIRLGLVDEISVYMAPMIFGGVNSPTLADGIGLTQDEAIHLKIVDIEKEDGGGVFIKYKL